MDAGRGAAFDPASVRMVSLRDDVVGIGIGQSLFLLLGATGIDIPSLSDDPDDDKYVAAALEGRATFVVAGDPDVLTLKSARACGS
jgi:hypothetical protein